LESTAKKLAGTDRWKTTQLFSNLNSGFMGVYVQLLSQHPPVTYALCAKHIGNATSSKLLDTDCHCSIACTIIVLIAIYLLKLSKSTKLAPPLSPPIKIAISEAFGKGLCDERKVTID
jgi:hypothetical protein